MCMYQVVGDYYRGCGHFHGRYYTGEVQDCGSLDCKSSIQHRHRTTINCGCPEIARDDVRIQNMFHLTYQGCPPQTQQAKQAS